MKLAIKSLRVFSSFFILTIFSFRLSILALIVLFIILILLINEPNSSFDLIGNCFVKSPLVISLVRCSINLIGLVIIFEAIKLIKMTNEIDNK